MADEQLAGDGADEPQLRHPTPKRDIGDALLDGLVENDPKGFLGLLGIPVDGPVQIINAGVFPCVIPIDRVLRVTASESMTVVVSLATVRDHSFVSALLATYSSLYEHGPVQPLGVLVRPEADDSTITGSYESWSPSGRGGVSFRYLVIRAWEHQADLRDVTDSELDWIAGSGLPEYIEELRLRAERDDITEPATCLVFASTDENAMSPELRDWADTLERMAPCCLLFRSLREDARIVSQHEACVVMRWKLYQLGTHRLGVPDQSIVAAIGAITSPRRLTDLDHYVGRIESRDQPIATWDELLAWHGRNSS